MPEITANDGRIPPFGRVRALALCHYGGSVVHLLHVPKFGFGFELGVTELAYVECLPSSSVQPRKMSEAD